MLHGEEIHVEEPIDAVAKTALLSPVELRVLDSAGDAFIPTDLGQAVGFCMVVNESAATAHRSQASWAMTDANVRDWICERCCSLARNCRNSALSLSLSLSRSAFSRLG